MTKAKRPHINLIALLFVTIAFAIIVQYYGSREQSKPAASKQIDRPDFFLNQANTRIMDEQGKIRYQLDAEKISHAPKLDESHLAKPQITTYGSKKDSWVMTADKGVMPDHKELATFSGNVITTKYKNPSPDDKKIELVANSDQMTYNANRQTVTSQGNVTVKTKSHLISGNKMVADIPADTMEITTNVKTSIKSKD